MSLIYAKDMAFPKIIYDKGKLEKWTNKVGAAIAVSGNVNDAIATTFKPSSLPEAVLTLVSQTVAYTKEFMGANDAVLGNVNPENTSAIIALQKSSAAPLELQRLEFYQFIEDLVRTIYEIMKVKFGSRYVLTEAAVTDPVSGEKTTGEVAQLVDFSQMPVDSDVIVDIGASDYWSEITQTNTMDNLFKSGILTDAVAYVESVPDKNIKNKQEIIEKIRAEQKRRQHLEELRAINRKNTPDM